MSRAKASKGDPRGAHVRLYHSIMDSPAWLALSFAQRTLYFELRRYLNGANNGNIDATLSKLRHRGLRSSATLAQCLRALRAVGLIDMTRQGQIASGGKFCSLYRFTDEPVYELPKQGVKATPATNDWRQFKNIGEAEQSIRQADEAAKWTEPKKVARRSRGAEKNESKLQTAKRVGSTSKSEGRLVDSLSESGGARPIRDLNAARSGTGARKSLPANGFPAEWSLVAR